MIFIVVESPTKAKAINEYLKGEKEEYRVLSTFGHIRNLITKSNSIEVTNNYAYKWKNTAAWEKHKKEVLDNAKRADKIIVATDLDREGEGIAWHFLEMLKANKISKPTERIIFHSVSKSAILEALQHSASLRLGLVESYLARIGLDYLFGFSISPLLWHKIPCCKSAGRVQSVALRLIVEREAEIKKFVSEKYLTVHAKFKESSELASMISLDGENFENGNIFKKDINPADLYGKFIVKDIKTQTSKQFAPAPLITATLQQAASSKLNFSPAFTMQLAQKLYEGFSIKGKHVGLITYMRTDSTNIEPEFIKKIRDTIKSKFGSKYLPSSSNVHKTSAKGAQEAHEAIRPVDLSVEPSDLHLDNKNLENLYKLIWERTVASQMAPAQLETISVKIEGKNEKHDSIFELKATNTIFSGFKIVTRQNEEGEEDEESRTVSFASLKLNAELTCKEISKKEHETQPPHRFSEATLIQQLKKRGIGRPSTYAKIIEVLYEREYATREKKTIIPTQRGWIVTAFLKHFFKDEVAYEFTANLEEDLDSLNENNGNHIEILEKFWKHLESKIDEVTNKNPIEISAGVQQEFGHYFLQDQDQCPKCGKHMMLKISKFGAMLGCENYPECKAVINIGEYIQPAEIGTINGQKALVKIGPYGPYVEFQIDEAKPKRIPIPKIWQSDLENLKTDFPIEKIEFLASLPKAIGELAGEKIHVSIGMFGPFLKYKETFVSIKDPINITLEKAIVAIEKKLAKPKSTYNNKTIKKPTPSRK